MDAFKIIVTEKIPGAKCEPVLDNKYECLIQEGNSVINIPNIPFGFINNIILLISGTLFIILLGYRLLAKYTKIISNINSGKKVFKYILIIFIISLLLSSLSLLGSIIAPWIYK